MSDTQTLHGVRRLILVSISAALIVTAAELLFVGNTGGSSGQRLAAVLVGLGLSTVTCQPILRNTSGSVVFRFTTYLFLIFGIDGFLTHHHRAVQAALKSQPSLEGMPLLYATL